MHPAAYDWIYRHHSMLRRKYRGAKILEIGSLNVNGEIRPIFSWASAYVGLDQQAGPNVDVVADATLWDYPDKEFNIVISTEMLEHCRDWPKVVDEIHHTLIPGGVFIQTCACDPRVPHGQYGAQNPAEGEWYKNVCPMDLLDVLTEKWFDVTINVLGPDVRSIAYKPAP